LSLGGAPSPPRQKHQLQLGESWLIDNEMGIMQTVVKDLLPQKTRWSQRAVARHLVSDRQTIKSYAEQIAIVVPDYLRECPRNPDGSVMSGMSLSQYQAWVVCQLVTLGRTIRADLNGTSYRKVVKVTAVKQANLLSRAAWQEMQGHNS
jgi:hypothetical protein